MRAACSVSNTEGQGWNRQSCSCAGSARLAQCPDSGLARQHQAAVVLRPDRVVAARPLHLQKLRVVAEMVLLRACLIDLKW